MPEAILALKPLTPDRDISSIEPLYATSHGPSLSFLSNLLAQPSCRAWLLESDKEPVAAVWYQCAVGHAELIDLRVAASCRRQGFGKQLLSASLVTMEDLTQVNLEVRSSNTAAQALYRSLAFEETGRRSDYYASVNGQEDAVLMTLRLNSNR